jgi:hypothetical protein
MSLDKHKLEQAVREYKDMMKSQKKAINIEKNEIQR